MKKIALSVVTSLSLLTSITNAEDLNTTVQTQTPPPLLEPVAENEPTYFGYNYIGFGIETATYTENGQHPTLGWSSKSSVTTTSPVYTSGGLIKMNKYFDFSIDAASTLMPTTATEKVQNTDTGSIEFTNNFDSVQSDLKFLIQYKLNNNHRLAIGPNYNLFSMKRYDFSSASEKFLQEDISTLNMMIGYIYEYAPFSNDGMRIKLGALYGKPIWNKATNTNFPDVSASSTKGFTADLDGYIGFELMKGLEAGFFSRYSLKKKDGSTELEDADGHTATWPDNELETFRYGVSFVWNFDVK